MLTSRIKGWNVIAHAAMRHLCGYIDFKYSSGEYLAPIPESFLREVLMLGDRTEVADLECSKQMDVGKEFNVTMVSNKCYEHYIIFSNPVIKILGEILPGGDITILAAKDRIGV